MPIPDEKPSIDDQDDGDIVRPEGTPDRDQEPEGGQKPEAVEDRPSVGTVDPEDYPKDRADG